MNMYIYRGYFMYVYQCLYIILISTSNTFEHIQIHLVATAKRLRVHFKHDHQINVGFTQRGLLVVWVSSLSLIMTLKPGMA